MKKIALIPALFVFTGSICLLSLWPKEVPKKSQRTHFITTDTTYFKVEGKECRLIKLKSANNVKLCR